MFFQRCLLSICVAVVLNTASAQQLNVTLTGSMHNGSGVPCFGKKEGTITSAVSGGTAPYTYLWSNGETTPHLSGVAAGYYSVEVKDATAEYKKVEITLTEPEPLKLTPTVSLYGNGENISCFECNNGWIQIGTTQGTPPYSYAWQDGPSTSANRYGLGPKEYKVTVTDANGCEEGATIRITQPQRSDWTMSGNAGTNPSNQYIGTSDNKDVVFKANGQESLRLGSDGTIKLLGQLSGSGPLIRDEDGGLRLGGDENLPQIDPNDCYTRGHQPYWNSTGNAFGQICPDFIPKLGTLTPVNLDVVTNGITRMTILPEGNVGIGTTTPTNALTVASATGRAVVELDNRNTSSSAGTELRFSKNGEQRWGLGADFAQDGSQDFYLWDHLAVDGGGGTPGRIRMRVDHMGRVGFGGYEIWDQLTVSGAGRASIGIRTTDPGSSACSIFFRKEDHTATWELASDLNATGGRNFYIRDKVEDKNRIFIDEHGGVAIGEVTTPTNYLLAVEKGIITDRIKVALHTGNDWSDHVFKPGYALMSLEQVAAYIKEHGHLPGVPSAEQMVEQGLDVVKTDAMLLEKIEEMTLHMIAMEKRVLELEDQNKALKLGRKL